MHTKLLAVSLLLFMQVCDQVSAQTDPPGILQRLTDKVSSAKTKVQTLGTTLYGYAETYYEDNIQPLTDSYTQWASGVKNSVLEKIQHTVGNYIPITANETDSAGQQ
ncbi:apolipoprotein C-IV [Nelusetta ayraudi]|uniref:apolipoprotein C-IV n=1 Tax=Nelusetta ayraudi TaxID=303726 RepID=UPI003F6FCA38